jgi:hypothetical protein
MWPIALIIGGAENALAEYAAACELVRLEAGNDAAVFAVNDMIAAFPRLVDHAVTLHPAKIMEWLRPRHNAGLAPPLRAWCHRDGQRHFTDWSPDWGGSSGLFAVKIARELDFRRIILCGVPMTVEGGHFRRGQRWPAAFGFRPAWERHAGELRPYVRSMSGWTRELLGAPGTHWAGA